MGKTRTGWAISAVAIAAAAALVAPMLNASAATPAASAHSVKPVPTGTRLADASYGAGWLATQITDNGGFISSFGVPNVSDTAYAVLALHAAGVGENAGAEAMGYLETQLTGALKASDGTDSPGALAYFIMAAVASGENPRKFGGTAKRNNLVGRLFDTERTSGPDEGLFGTADPTFDGAFRQGLALDALAAANVSSSDPRVLDAVGWLVDQQCTNGLWTSYRADVSTPCPAADPDTFAGPDTNSTGMAAQGLAAYGFRPRKSNMFAALRAVQNPDGGFPFLAAPGQSDDPNSDALVIQAILAYQAKPDAAYWRATSGTPYSALLAFQLGCGAPAADRGAFFFPGDSTPNAFATVQAVPAAAGVTLPLPASALAPAVPVPACPAAHT